jgi:two-component system chemotaxis response regulator CheB
MSSSEHSPVNAFDLITVVSSLGGLEPLRVLMAGLPETFSVPLVVVQHSARDAAPERLAGLLQRHCKLPVTPGRPFLSLGSAGVTVVPPASVAVIEKPLRLRLNEADHAKIGDVLFCSAAQASGPRTIGVVLSGMQRDGARGVQAIRRRGGRVLAQDPSTASAPEMPSAAIATGCVDFVLPPECMASALVALTMAPGGADFFKVSLPPWATLGAELNQLPTTA